MIKIGYYKIMFELNTYIILWYNKLVLIRDQDEQPPPYF